MKTVTVPGTIARVWMRVDHDLSYHGYDRTEIRTEVRSTVPAVRAQLATSLMRHRKGWHAPVLDLDVPHTLVPSSTAGHSHLYLDVPMSWWRYKRLLKALAKAGVVEKGYVKASIARGHTAVRAPWVKKENA